VVWKLARERHSRRRVAARWLYGTEVELVLTSDIGRCVWVAGCFEPNEMYLLSTVLGSGCTFVDVGANIGLYSLLAARIVGEEGRVLSFEPSPRERELLEDNIARNGLSQVAIDGRALGDAPNDGVVLHLADELHAGQNTLGSVVYENVRLAADVTVEMTTLDHAVRQSGLDKVDVVKIDVEGAEFAVLSGARDILRTMRPLLMMELQDLSLAAQGSGAREVLELLSGFDYEVYRYAERGHQRLVRPLTDADAVIAQDVVAVPAERKEVVVRL